LDIFDTGGHGQGFEQEELRPPVVLHPNAQRG